MTQDEARALFSEYLDNALDAPQRDEMQAFLAREPECAAELFALERTLSLLHRLPPREPALDIWRELAPRVEKFQAERRQPWLHRVRLQWEQARSQASDGVILWTDALAARAKSRLSHYLRHEHGLRTHAKGRREKSW